MTVDFIRPSFVGRELKVEGRMREVTSDREAIAEGFIYNADGEVCARSVGKFAVFSTDKLRKMGVADPEIFDWFERFIERSP